jgi:hypothetical protein
MDLVTLIAAIPGTAPALPYVAVAVSVCGALAVVLPHPVAESTRLYVAIYRLVNFVALNFGYARNARACADPAEPRQMSALVASMPGWVKGIVRLVLWLRERRLGGVLPPGRTAGARGAGVAEHACAPSAVRQQIISFLWQALAVILIAAAGFAVSTFAAIVPALFGGHISIAIDGIGAHASVRYCAALLYFVAGSVAAVMAWKTASFAAQRFGEVARSQVVAEGIPVSAIHLGIICKWDSTEIHAARIRIAELVASYEALGEPDRLAAGSVGTYVRDAIVALDQNPMQQSRYTIIIRFFDELGLLCRKGYVREPDIFDFIGESISRQMAYLASYIDHVRKDDAGTVAREVHANAVYLHNAVRAHKPEPYRADFETA